MQKDLDLIIECYSCGLFVKKEHKKGFIARCPRCNSKIKSQEKNSIDSLFYAISSIMLFLILSLYPLISLSINEQYLEANILKTVYILFEQEFYFVAFLTLFTIVLAPLFNSFIIIFVFIQSKLKTKILNKNFLYKAYYFSKNWGFMEVFIISLIVTYIKLIDLVGNTTFDIGFYIMFAYIFCFIMSNLKFNSDFILEK